MSNHGHHPMDQSREEKPESSRYPGQPPVPLVKQPVVHSEIIKTSYQGKKHPTKLNTLQQGVPRFHIQPISKQQLPNRPIAPALGGISVPHPQQVPAAAAEGKGGSGQVVGHTTVNIVPKVSVPVVTGLMGNRFDTPLHSQSQQQHPAQQPIQVAPPSGQHVISSTTAVSVQPSMGNPVQTSVQLGAPPAHHGQHVTAAAHGGMRLGPVAGASQQLSAAASVAQVPHMASIIRGQPPASALQSQHALQHAFTSHVPRGAAAASALTIPKSSTLATAVLRPSQPAGMTLPVSSSAPILQNIHPQIQPRTPLLSAVRPGTPPVTRAGSPAVSVPLPGQHGTDTHRPVLSHHLAATTTTTVQITIQQPRTTQEVTGRSLPGQPPQHITSKPIHTSHPIIQQHQPQQHAGQHPATPTSQLPPQAKLMSQAAIAPIIHHATAASSTGGTAIPKTIPISIQSSGIVPVTNSLSGSSTVVSTATIPIAKVQPQRQLGHSVPSSEVRRDGAPLPQAKVHPQRQHPPSQQTQPLDLHRDSQAAAVAPPAGNIFLSPTHRGSPNTNQPQTTTIALPTTVPHTDSRPERPNMPHIADYSLFNYYTAAAGLMYSHPQAPGFVPVSTALRPGLVPRQNPNIAATLQAAAHGVTLSSSPGVRINHPIMMTVDPSCSHPLPLPHGGYTSAPDAVSGKGAEGVMSTTPSGGTHTTTVQGAPLTPGAPANQQPGPNLTASPRPSILRKRTNDGTIIVKKASAGPTPTGSDASSPAMPEVASLSATSSPKPTPPLDPSRENSQSSTDTASSAENTPPPAQPPVTDLKMKIKQEPPDSIENGAALTGSMINHAIQNAVKNSVEASPRKKPRKQLLNAQEELKDGLSTDEDAAAAAAAAGKRIIPKIEKKEEKPAKEDLDEFTDDEGIKWTREKRRPNISLMNHYNCTWKAKNNHFYRRTDVKVKEERRPTVNELSNQKGVNQKASGWKLFHIAAQIEDLVDIEKGMLSHMSGIQKSIAPKGFVKETMEDDIGMVHEITQGNIQRCRLVADQLDEAKSSMIKLLDHKARIQEIITKHHSKRPVKKKERT